MASTPTRKHIDVVKIHFSRCASLKVGYESRDEALDVAEIMMHNDHVLPGCHITPYLCDDCGQWHVFNRRIVWAS